MNYSFVQSLCWLLLISITLSWLSRVNYRISLDKARALKLLEEKRKWHETNDQ